MISIEYLSDYPDCVGNVAHWLYDLYDELDYNFEDEADYKNLYAHFQNNSKTELPIRLIALSDGKCVGTVTFIDNDFPGKTYTPWLGGLYVDIPYRNCGIGQKLIAFVKRIAKDLGYAEIYLGAENAGKYYKNLGWKCVETCANESGRMCEIYKCEV